jgi:aminopeptidase
MPNQNKLEKFAKLAVEVGANVQKNQEVVVRSSVESKDFARLIVKAAYEAGAKRVSLMWSDPYTARTGYDYMTPETLEEVPEWLVTRAQGFIDTNACMISITSPIPGLNKGVSPEKLQRQGIATSKKLKFYSDHMMGNHAQWTIVAAPNPVWAEKVFPNLKSEEAVEALWDAIFEASRVTDDNNPVAEWDEHNERLLSHNKILNEYNFETLHFTNKLGTDLKLKLVKNHVWAGGGENTTKGVYFNPNIPTEENFTMPDKFGVEGRVVATKPLNYNGNLIDEFWLDFKDGKVVDYDAKQAKETLKSLIEFDEGSSRLGEVALISHNSPIQNSGILFYNTLFDENASCHLALGRAYPMNIKNGTSMTQEELEAAGSNNSMTHVDFMFGSADMNIVGTTYDGKEVQIFKDGDFVI